MLKACAYSKEADTTFRRQFVMRRPTANRNQALILTLLAHVFELLPNVPRGLAGGKMVHQGVIASCPDLQTSTEDLFAEGDKVVERWSMDMTLTEEPFLGAPANGRHVQVTGTSIYRIADGKIVEHWANMDFLGVVQQLGLAPS